MNIRILLADDHMVFREGLRVLLANESDFEIVGEASGGQMAIDLAQVLSPDVVVMDVVMPDMNGVEATRQICAAPGHARVVGLSSHSDKRYVLHMLGAGASGYVLKNAAHSDLVDAVRATNAGLAYLSSEIRSCSAELRDPR